MHLCIPDPYFELHRQAEDPPGTAAVWSTRWLGSNSVDLINPICNSSVTIVMIARDATKTWPRRVALCPGAAHNLETEVWGRVTSGGMEAENPDLNNRHLRLIFWLAQEHRQIIPNFPGLQRCQRRRQSVCTPMIPIKKHAVSMLLHQRFTIMLQ